LIFWRNKTNIQLYKQIQHIHIFLCYIHSH
jgi:hypothetical protein